VCGRAPVGQSYEAAEAKDVLRPFHPEHDRRRIIGVYRSHSNIQRGNREASALSGSLLISLARVVRISTNELSKPSTLLLAFNFGHNAGQSEVSEDQVCHGWHEDGGCR
jgi:hypothetical protein